MNVVSIILSISVAIPSFKNDNFNKDILQSFFTMRLTVFPNVHVYNIIKTDSDANI